MAEDQSSDADKTEEPSAHRLQEFRNRGDVASSRDLTSILILCASIMTLTLTIVYIYETLGHFFEWVYGLKVEAAFSKEMRPIILEKIGEVSLKCVAPVFVTVLIVGVLSNVLQIGFLFSPDILSFKPERIDPIAGIKRMFSMRSVVEAIKSVFKFVIILAITYVTIRDDIKSYGGFLQIDVLSGFEHAKWMLAKLGFAILLGLLVVALFDFAYQKLSYRKRLMMTKEEAKKEMKEQEGSPEIRQRIRSIQREMARKRMISEIPKADVIVTNPTHLSVALKYDSETMVSPCVIGKGADHLALRIREIAKENNVPIVENVPLARALYKSVKLNDPVPRSLYKAVAEVLAFVYRLRRKEKAVSSGSAGNVGSAGSSVVENANV